MSVDLGAERSRKALAASAVIPQNPGMASSRALSGTDRYWLSITRLTPPCVITLVVDHEGEPLGVELLRAAVDAVADARPDTRLRLHGERREAVWQPDGPPPVVVMHDRPLVGPLGAVDADAMQRAAPLEPEAGPGLSVHVMPGTDGGGRLVLRGCHAVIDGRGLVAVLLDLVAALRSEPLVPVGLGPPEDSLAIAATAPPYGWGHSPFGSVRDPSRLGMHYLHRRLGPVARPLHAVVRAAVEVAGARGIPADQVRVGVPVDLRRHDAALARVGGNLHSLVYHHGPDPGDLRARIEAGEHRGALAHAGALRDLTIGDATRIAAADAAEELAHDAPERSIVVSNLGRLPLVALDLRDRRAKGRHWLPPSAAGIPIFLGLFGDDESLELGATIPATWADAAAARSFMDDVCDRLGAPGVPGSTDSRRSGSGQAGS